MHLGTCTIIIYLCFVHLFRHTYNTHNVMKLLMLQGLKYALYVETCIDNAYSDRLCIVQTYSLDYRNMGCGRLEMGVPNGAWARF